MPRTKNDGGPQARFSGGKWENFVLTRPRISDVLDDVSASSL